MRRSRWAAVLVVAFVGGYGAGLLAEPATGSARVQTPPTPAQYSGVGLWVRTMGDGRVTITRVVAGSAADAAGIQIGERLADVGGKPTTDLAADRSPGCCAVRRGARSRCWSPPQARGPQARGPQAPARCAGSG
ncbi:MAG: PDZ domain-containing protein [Sporichthyaceae bacterium]|nr:PDZ domain-containing protein [Sporichthyaceae bacterium]